jgi:hypothetical protein
LADTGPEVAIWEASGAVQAISPEDADHGEFDAYNHIQLTARIPTA